MSDITSLTELMESHIKTIRQTMSAEQKAVVDAVVMIERVKLCPDRYTVAQLRGMAMRYTNGGQPFLAACMDLLADKIEEGRKIETNERDRTNANQYHTTLS